MTRDEWIADRARQIELEMPDAFPVGYARHLAEVETEWMEFDE